MTLHTVPILARCQLSLPDGEELYTFIKANAAHADTMVQPDTGRGKRVAICGAGVSLAETAKTIPNDVAEVWACNSALPYMVDHGYRVTHGFAIDQGVAMLADHEWGRALDVQYLVASSVSPKLVQHLRDAGRALTYFHSFLGLPDPPDWTPPADRPDVSYEMWLYTTIFPTGVQVGYGLNSVPRAICLALFLGFDEILVYGADCACAPDQAPMPSLETPEYEAWMRNLVMYADGRTAIQYGAQAVMAEAVIDGKRWHTRPDMVISATMMVDLVKQHSHIHVIGDTLPAVLLTQPPEFFDDMPRLVGVGDIQGFGAHYPPLTVSVP